MTYHRLNHLKSIGFIRKVTPLVALTFFLHPLESAAQSFNISDGDVYGDSNIVATSAAIASQSSGTNNLDVFYNLTTSVDLEDDVFGYINVSNRFDNFTITSPSGSLTTDFEPVLSVHGGTNLHIEGGSYLGILAQVESNGWSGGIGALIDGVATARVSMRRLARWRAARRNEAAVEARKRPARDICE